MNNTINTVWLVSGIAVLIYGAAVFRKKRFGLILCIGKSRVADRDGFSDSFGKAIALLGGMSVASSVLCRGDAEYALPALVLTGLSVIYFILESFHLVKLYGESGRDDNL